MRRLMVWLLGGFALFGFLRRRREAVSDARADELRRKLAESRAIVEERDEFEGAETTVDQAEPAPAGPIRLVDAAFEPPGESVETQPGGTELEDPEERRRTVHEAGRAAAERMRGRSS